MFFGKGGDSERFRREGWANTEQVSTWALGPMARLKFKVDSANKPLGIRMRLSALCKAPELPFQPVYLSANNVQIAAWEVSRPADFTAVVPPDVLQKEHALHLELRFPRATSPQALGYSIDSRSLGVSCFEVQITKTVAIADIWPHRFAR